MAAAANRACSSAKASRGAVPLNVVAAQLPDAVVGVGQQFAGESGALTKAKPPVAPAHCAATGIDALFPSRLPQVRGGAFRPALPC